MGTSRPVIFPQFHCSNGHDRVEWGITGGYLGDDRKCWYCKQPTQKAPAPPKR